MQSCGFAFSVVLLFVSASFVSGCTTLVASRLTTTDGSILTSHSNDGDTTVAANLMKVEAAEWPAGATRQCSGGTIPQVQQTYAYFTKPGGVTTQAAHTLTRRRTKTHFGVRMCDCFTCEVCVGE